MDEYRIPRLPDNLPIQDDQYGRILATEAGWCCLLYRRDLSQYVRPRWSSYLTGQNDPVIYEMFQDGSVLACWNDDDQISYWCRLSDMVIDEMEQGWFELLEGVAGLESREGEFPPALRIILRHYRHDHVEIIVFLFTCWEAAGEKNPRVKNR